jgi:hypothetical protein
MDRVFLAITIAATVGLVVVSSEFSALLTTAASLR